MNATVASSATRLIETAAKHVRARRRMMQMSKKESLFKIRVCINELNQLLNLSPAATPAAFVWAMW